MTQYAVWYDLGSTHLIEAESEDQAAIDFWKTKKATLPSRVFVAPYEQVEQANLTPYSENEWNPEYERIWKMFQSTLTPYTFSRPLVCRKGEDFVAFVE